MANEISICSARPDEQAALESLQRRASLNNPGVATRCSHIRTRSRQDGGAELEALSCGFHVIGTAATQFGVGLAMRRSL